MQNGKARIAFCFAVSPIWNNIPAPLCLFPSISIFSATLKLISSFPMISFKHLFASVLVIYRLSSVIPLNQYHRLRLDSGQPDDSFKGQTTIKP